MMMMLGNLIEIPHVPPLVWIIFYGIIGILLVCALIWETAAVQDTHRRANQDLDFAKTPSTSTCDRVQIANQLIAYTENKSGVQWRNGLIAAVCSLILVIVLAQVKVTPLQGLILMLVVWLTVTTTSSFRNYHLQEVSSNTTTQILQIAQTGFDQATCTTNFYYPI